MPKSPSLYFLIQQANRQVARRVDALLKSEGITAAQQLVLYILSMHAPCSSAELARRLRVTAQAMGEFVRALESRGLIARSDADSTGRAILLQLTAEGKAVYRRCGGMIVRSEREFLAVLPESNRERFVADLLMLGTVKNGD
jgi:DNA-binding MarR family transcriptional regulator